jgi:hypothetical protein
MSDAPPVPRPEPVPPERLRVGDTERQQAAAALGEHYAAGRLDQGEFDTRVQAAYGARTLVDLRGLFTDLPAPAPFRPAADPAWRAGRAARDRRSHPALPLFPLLFVAAIVASAAFHAPIFPIVLLLWFVVGRLGWGGWSGQPRRPARN